MSEQKIMDAINKHHEYVKNLGYKVVMTSLCGSQNYKLDTPNSDFDTYTFVLPSAKDVMELQDPVSTLFEDDLGHINIKDIRLALKLLKKTSTNSVEWFATKYRIIEDVYIPYIEPYINDPDIFRCDTNNMMNAIGGMAHQLTKRNMPAGKRYSHLIRMSSMIDNYFDLSSDILSVKEPDIPVALEAKRDAGNPVYNTFCEEMNEIIQEKILDMQPRYKEFEEIENNGRNLVAKILHNLFQFIV